MPRGGAPRPRQILRRSESKDSDTEDQRELSNGPKGRYPSPTARDVSLVPKTGGSALSHRQFPGISSVPRSQDLLERKF